MSVLVNVVNSFREKIFWLCFYLMRWTYTQSLVWEEATEIERLIEYGIHVIQRKNKFFGTAPLTTGKSGIYSIGQYVEPPGWGRLLLNYELG